jgi:hypothetical protein
MEEKMKSKITNEEIIETLEDYISEMKSEEEDSATLDILSDVIDFLNGDEELLFEDGKYEDIYEFQDVLTTTIDELSCETFVDKELICMLKEVAGMLT